ncbi:MAG: hypothetical protein P8045_01160 [Candidatus Thiodiazotropha sp.]|jgi:ribosomal protein S12 methylthiotransferase accessory factor YcaO
MVRERHSANPIIRERKSIRSRIGLALSDALIAALLSVLRRIGINPQLRDEPNALTIEVLCPLTMRVRRNPDR